MPTYAEKNPIHAGKAVEPMGAKPAGGGGAPLADNRPATAQMQSMQAIASASPRMQQLKTYQGLAKQGATPARTGVVQAMPVGSAAVVQRVTATPASVTVHIGAGAVVKVTNDETGAELNFRMMDALPETIPEGTVVISPGGKLNIARFANENTASASAAGLAKIKTVNTKAAAVPQVQNLAAASSSGEERKSAPVLRLSEIETSRAGQDSIFPKGMGLTPFEKTAASDKGDDHFQKHGHEFGATDKNAYVRNAQEFGRSTGNQFVEARIKNTIIRFDPKTHAIVIANGKQLRTFYKWDGKYSDPVAYAIYYTITHNMQKGLAELDGEVFDKFRMAGHDIEAMENEYIRIGLLDGKSEETLREETHAPRKKIDALMMMLAETHPEIGMELALTKGKRAPQGFTMPDLTEEEIAALGLDEEEDQTGEVTH